MVKVKQRTDKRVMVPTLNLSVCRRSDQLLLEMGLRLCGLLQEQHLHQHDFKLKNFFIKFLFPKWAEVQKGPSSLHKLYQQRNNFPSIEWLQGLILLHSRFERSKTLTRAGGLLIRSSLQNFRTFTCQTPDISSSIKVFSHLSAPILSRIVKGEGSDEQS